MMRRVLAIGLFLGATVLLTGADSVTLTKATPNPGGVVQKCKGEGSYTLDPNLQHSSYPVSYIMALTNSTQTTVDKTSIINSTPTGGDWECTLVVAAGTYDCQATIQRVDRKNGGVTVRQFSTTVQVTVK